MLSLSFPPALLATSSILSGLVPWEVNACHRPQDPGEKWAVRGSGSERRRAENTLPSHKPHYERVGNLRNMLPGTCSHFVRTGESSAWWRHGVFFFCFLLASKHSPLFSRGRTGAGGRLSSKEGWRFHSLAVPNLFGVETSYRLFFTLPFLSLPFYRKVSCDSFFFF